MSTEDSCASAARLLGEARAVLVVTGAGVSTESGIPDFRSPGGLWSRYDPRELTYDKFCTREATREAYWRLATEAYPLLRDAAPGPAHHAVAAIERGGRLLRLVTQNVDGLHAKAGNSPERTIEIHGSSLRAGCIACGLAADREAIHRRLVEGPFEVPLCEACGGFLKPATISFGQAMPERETMEAFAAARDCDLVIVIGSSMVVYPAAGIPDEAVAAGAPLVVVNNEPTPKDDLARVIVRGAAGASMADIVALAGLDRDRQAS
jgi:NAD-dependent deacetylase